MGAGSQVLVMSSGDEDREEDTDGVWSPMGFGDVLLILQFLIFQDKHKTRKFS